MTKTFAELAIVSTIIAVLVSVSIHVYSFALQNVRERVDEVNIRALNYATTLYYTSSEENICLKNLDSEELELELSDYLSNWPVSPSGKEYSLQDGLWNVE